MTDPPPEKLDKLLNIILDHNVTHRQSPESPMKLIKLKKSKSYDHLFESKLEDEPKPNQAKS